MKRLSSAAFPLALSALVACESPTVDALVGVDAMVEPMDDDASESEGATDDPVPSIFVSCDEVFSQGRAGDACKLEKDCSQTLKCSRHVARCVAGLLFFSMEDSCSGCDEDTDCGPGLLCVGEKCTDCPAPKDCLPCPSGFAYLSRNECKTCVCGPVSECSGATCDAGLACALGAFCADDCKRLDCCANVCAEPGCPDPAPLGCAFPCKDAGCDGLCKAETCYCDLSSKTWQCKGFCADDAASILSCEVPQGSF